MIIHKKSATWFVGKKGSGVNSDLVSLKETSTQTGHVLNRNVEKGWECPVVLYFCGILPKERYIPHSIGTQGTITTYGKRVYVTCIISLLIKCAFLLHWMLTVITQARTDNEVYLILYKKEHSDNYNQTDAVFNNSIREKLRQNI